MGAPCTPLRRRMIVGGLVALVAKAAHAQSTPARVGFLSFDATSAGTQDAFRLGMREAGWGEGRQYGVTWGFADGDYARLPEIATRLVRGGLDVMAAVNTLAVQAARRATTTLPIVMVGVPDPIGEGFAASLSRPGGNVTGLSNIVTEVSVKHLELLHRDASRHVPPAGG